MAESGDNVARCVKCNTPLQSGTAIGIVVQTPEERKETILCEECAVVSCTNCGTDLRIDRLFGHGSDVWESQSVFECTRCEEVVPAREIVELRHKSNPNYRKRLCESCLQDVPIPSNIRVVRDVG